MTSTTNEALLEWERAEVARSGVQARLAHNHVERTAPHVIARYANPPAQTPYAWEYAFHLLGNADGHRVLDLGCGDGECTSLVASHGGDVAALDISLDLLAMARTRVVLDGYSRSVRPLCGSVHSIPMTSDSVDVVFGMAVLHHVDLKLAAQEVYRVLKPGGRAIFVEPIRNSKTLAAIRRLIPYRQPDISPFERPLRFDEIDEFASRFRSWQRRVFELPFVQLARVCRIKPSWQSRAYALDTRLLHRFPPLRRFASVMVFELRK
jgi:ubiquinone/menaquinone biosynthesis C-methylase UbiE